MNYDQTQRSESKITHPKFISTTCITNIYGLTKFLGYIILHNFYFSGVMVK